MSNTCKTDYIYIYIQHLYAWFYDVGKSKCKIDFHIKTKSWLTVQRLGFLKLNNRLAAGEGVLDQNEPEESPIHPLDDDKEKKSIAFVSSC